MSSPLLFWAIGIGGILLFIFSFVEPLLSLNLIALVVPLALEFQGPLPFRPEDILIVPLVLAWVARVVVGRERRHPTPLDLPLVMFVMTGLISLLVGVMIGTTVLLGPDPRKSGLPYLLKRIELLLLFATTASIARGYKRMKTVLLFLLAGIMLRGIFAFAFANPFSGELLSGEQPPFHRGEFGLVGVCLGLSLALFTSRKWEKLFCFATALIAGILIPPFGDRNELVATLVSLVVIALLSKKWPVMMAVVGLPLFFLASKRIFSPPVFEYSFKLTGEAIWKFLRGEYVQILTPRPIFKFPTHFATVMLNAPLGYGLGCRTLGWYDSEYIVQLYYSGIPGFAVFMWLLWSVAKMGWGMLRSPSNPFERGLCIGFMAMFVGYLVAALIAPTFSAVKTAEFFWLNLGLMAALYPSKRERGVRQV